MAKEKMHMVDIVKTGKLDYLMVDVKNRGEVAYALDILPRAILDEVYSLRDDPRLILVEGFKETNTGLDIPPGTFGDLTSDRELLKFAETYAANQRETARIYASDRGNQKGKDVFKTTTDDALNHIQFNILVSVWEQLIKQHANNFLPYDAAHLTRAKYTENEIKLANAINPDKDDRGDFEVHVFNVLSQTKATDNIYPVVTSMVRLKHVLYGKGGADFRTKF